MGKISNYTRVLLAKLQDVFVCDQTDNNVTTTKSVTVEQVGDAICGEQVHSDLKTDNQTIIGGINELAKDKNIADEYDDTHTYNTGDVTIYGNTLYICTTNNTTGDFDPSNWTATTIDNVIGDLSDLTTSNKSSVVGAVNEIASYTPVYGNTASGTIATFDTSLALPLQDCTIAINAVQEGSGTPSPDNVRPITGFTECNVKRTGKNLINPTLSPDRNPRINNITVTKGYDNVILTTTATADYMCYGVFYSLKKGTYTFKYQANSSDSYTPYVTIYRPNSVVVVTNIAPNTAITFTLDEDATIEVRMFASTIGNGVVGRVITFYEMQLELGTTATDYEPYNSETKTIDFNGNTVYYGTLDVTSGVLTVTHAIDTFSSFALLYCEDNGYRMTNTLSHTPKVAYGNCLCNCFTGATSYADAVGRVKNSIGYNNNGVILLNYYTDGSYVQNITALNSALPTEGCKIAYELATPTIYQLTPTQISAIVGTNNVFTDTNGDTSVVYACSLKDYIDSQ